MSVNVKINQGFTNRQSQDYERLGVNDYLKVYWESARNQLISGGASPEQAGMAAAQNLISGTLGFNPFNVPDDQVVDANGVLNPNATFMWADDTDWEDAIQRTLTPISVRLPVRWIASSQSVSSAHMNVAFGLSTPFASTT